MLRDRELVGRFSVLNERDCDCNAPCSTTTFAAIRYEVNLADICDRSRREFNDDNLFHGYALSINAMSATTMLLVFDEKLQG